MCIFVIFLSTGFFGLEIYKMLKAIFLIKEYKKSKLHLTQKNLLKRAKLLSDAMETDLKDFDLKGN